MTVHPKRRGPRLESASEISSTYPAAIDRGEPGARGDGPRLIEPRLVALFLAGCVLFGYPFLGLFDRGGEIAGIPALFFYVFVAWSAHIALLSWLFESRDRRRAKGAEKNSEPRR